MSTSMESLRSDLKNLNENLEKNLHDLRERSERLEEAEKAHSGGVDEIRKAIDTINEEFVELRTARKAAEEKLARLEVIRTATTETERAINHQRLNKLFKRMVNSFGDGKGPDEKSFTEEERALMYPELSHRALGSMFDSEGGALIPIDFENTIYKAQYTMPGFRNIVTARPTGSSQASVITMGAVSGQWVGEAEETDESGVDFGNVTVPINKIRVEVPIPRDLLEDSAVDLMAEITDAVAMKFAEMEDIAFISGNGVKKPTGLFTNATLQHSDNIVKTLVAAALFDSTHNGVDQLRQMPVKLKQAHRTRGSYFMSAQTEATVRNLKDAYGQYLYHTNVAQGKPNTFDGYAVNISDNCPAVAANAFPIAFGDYNAAYAIRDRSGLVVEVDFSVQRKKDKVVIFVKKRLGGMPVITTTPAVCLLKVAA